MDRSKTVRPLGIVSALPEEMGGLGLALEKGELVEAAGYHFHHGRVDGHPVVLAEAGCGKVATAIVASLLADRFGCAGLVFSGVAGGLDPALPVGAVLLAERLAIHDYGVIAARRFTPTASGQIPIGAPELTALPAVRPEVAAAFARLEAAVADQLGHPIRRGGIVTADYFLNCAETRDGLRDRFAAEAIDIESGAIQQVADAWDRPLYVIRTLSDLAGEESHVTYGQMALMAAQNSALCVTGLLAILKGGADGSGALISIVP